MSSAWSIAASTASTVLGPISCPPSTSSASSSTTARAWTTFGASPSIVSRLPRSWSVMRSRSRSASRTPSPTVASSAATSLETERTSCILAQCRGFGRGHGQARSHTIGTLPSRTRALSGDTLAAGGGWNLRPHPGGDARAREPRWRRRRGAVSGELFAHQLAHGGAGRPGGDLWDDVGHPPADVAHARGADLGDRVVDDLLELLLRERLGHELLEHGELALLALGLLLTAPGPECLGRLGALLPLALQHLQLLVVVQRPLQVLLRRAQAGQDQPQRVATVRVARGHRLLELALQPRNQAHPAIPQVRPPSTCQCRWKTVCPAPSPTLTITR